MRSRRVVVDRLVDLRLARSSKNQITGPTDPTDVITDQVDIVLRKPVHDYVHHNELQEKGEPI
jgi:hypothetical protein